MRLTCTECGATYAVDDRVIPATGREVQCSGCQNRWFQKPEPETGTSDSADPVSSSSGAGDVSSTPDLKPEQAPVANLTRRQIDPEVLAILREEAEREQAARDAESAARANPTAPISEDAAPEPVVPNQAVAAQPADDADKATRANKKGPGFGTELWLAIVIFALCAVPYVFADLIVRTVPSLGDPIAAYVAGVESLRLWIFETWHSLTGAESNVT